MVHKYPARPKTDPAAAGATEATLHPAWKALMDYCSKLQYGEIERLRIQDGVPVIAEVITRKIKFTRQGE